MQVVVVADMREVQAPVAMLLVLVVLVVVVQEHILLQIQLL